MPKFLNLISLRNNNRYVNFNDINLDHDSILFSGEAGAVTVPSLIELYDFIKYSWKARQNLKNQLKMQNSKLKKK